VEVPLMSTHVGLGPVFAFEWLTNSRRWQIYFGRSLFVAGLLSALVVVWRAEVADKPMATIKSQALVGQSYYYAVVGTQLALVLLAAPAFTAGAICLDKARGTLAHVLVTDLSDAEIVLGKLAARLVPVLGLVACTLPVMALGTLLGGMDPVALTGAFIITMGTAILACSLSLLLSVWGKKTTEVLLATYAFLVFWVLGGPSLWVLRFSFGWTAWTLPEWFEGSNPFWLAFAPYVRPGATSLWDDMLFLTATLSLAAVLAGVSVWRLRPAAMTQAGGKPGRGRWAVRFALPRLTLPLPGPSLDGNPVLWREWHRNQPKGWTQLIWLGYAGASIACCLCTLGICLGGSKMSVQVTALVTGGQVALGFLLLCVVAPASLAEERVRGSLDVLMATPLSTRAIVWGKWWGTFRVVPWITLPVFLGTLGSGLRAFNLLGPLLEAGIVLAYGAAYTSLGLFLATWMPRQNRAAMTTVAVYVFMCVGWMFLALMMTGNSQGVTAPGLASGSPFLGSIFVGIQMHEPNMQHWIECVFWIVLWTILYTGVAVVLLGVTLATFDRRLGRMSAFPELDRARAFVERSRHPFGVGEGASSCHDSVSARSSLLSG
jgi:ABC-type transport system involved in multi-copper enzyme maturation permease subunit